MSSSPAAPPDSPPENSGTLYRAVWRWHFYAGLVAAPFAIFLAITGGIYLFKPQYEEWKYAALFNVPEQKATIPAEAQLAAAQAAKPGLRVNQFIPAFAPGRTAEVQFGPARARNRGAITKGAERSPAPAMSEEGDAQRLSVFVNPYTGGIVGELAERDREMATLRTLHGTMLGGWAGQTLIELAASWMFVLLLTGLYLWWPRPKFTVWGFLLPRLRAPGRIFWRDLHAVPAVWISAAFLYVLSSGIPWTKVGGAWLRTLSAAVGEGSPREMNAAAHRSELTGWSPPLKAGLATRIENLASSPPAALDEHAEHNGSARPAPASLPALNSQPSTLNSAIPRLTLDQVMAIAEVRQVPEPYALALPNGPTGVTSVLSHYYRPTVRTYLHLDQYSGKVLADVRFKDVGLYGKFVILGIAVHEGHAFGWFNQLLGVLLCLGVILLSASGIVLWWQRRPAGKLAAPASTAALPRPVFFGTLVLAVFLPLLAATLAVLLLLDRVRSRRLAPLTAARTT